MAPLSVLLLGDTGIIGPAMATGLAVTLAGVALVATGRISAVAAAE